MKNKQTTVIAVNIANAINILPVSVRNQEAKIWTISVCPFSAAKWIEVHPSLSGVGPSKKNLNSYYSLGDLTTWS